MDKKRTIRQNAALHLWFDLLSKSLNEAGLDMKKVLKPEIDIPWTGEAIKEFMWRPVQKALIDKESTTELTGEEIDLVFNTITRHLGEKFGVLEEFPSYETIMRKQMVEEGKKEYLKNNMSQTR